MQNFIKIQSPIKPKSYGIDKGIIYLTQLFGENHLNYGSFGLKGHQGWDFRTRHIDKGEAWVLAPHEGVIISDKNAFSITGGNYIKLQSPEFVCEGKTLMIISSLLHLTSMKYDKEQEIKRGMLIGITGNTGSFTTGSHLHWDIRVYEKLANNNWQSNQQNGYAGCVDPMLWINDDNVYQRGEGILTSRFYCNGRKLNRNEVENLIPKQYK